MTPSQCWCELPPIRIVSGFVDAVRLYKLLVIGVVRQIAIGVSRCVITGNFKDI